MQKFLTKRRYRVCESAFFLATLFAFLMQPIILFATTVNSNGNVVIYAVVQGSNNNNNNSGGGGGYSSPTSVTFSGRAYPLSHVILLEDGQQVLNTISGPDARFMFTVSGLYSGTYTFSILSEDSAGRRSTLFTIPIQITLGVATTVSGIFLAPTIEIDKTEVKRGDNLTIFGQTAPNALVTVSVHSNMEFSASTSSDSNGVYLYNLNTAPLEYGDHSTQTKASLASTNENQTTSYSNSLAFTVGQQTVEKKGACPAKGDINGDCAVNLVDFSIMAYWYHRINPPKKVDLDGDGKITLRDFSILAYYWTG